jgi:hypothetical protein
MKTVGLRGFVLPCMAAGLVMFAATAVRAQSTYRGTPEAQQACTPDAMRLCGEFIPDAGKVAACLARKRASLSPACHAVFSKPAKSKKRKTRRT